MKTSLSLAFGLALCLLLTSCEVDSVNPLSAPEASKPDPRLVGDWRGGEDSEIGTFRITMGKRSPWMHVEITPDAAGDKKDSYDFFPTVIGNKTYLNVRRPGKDGKPSKTYYLLRYKISGMGDRTLQMWMMSQDEASDAVEDGKVKGVVTDRGPSEDTDVTLKDTSENLVNFIRHSDLEDLFGDKMETLRRAKPAAKSK